MSTYEDNYIRNGHDGELECIQETMNRIERALSPILSQFDHVLVTGLSGVIPGAIFCYRHDKQLVVARKDGDRAHGGRSPGDYHFGNWKRCRYVILDDFVDTGKTLARVYEWLLDRGQGFPVATCLYATMAHMAVPTKHGVIVGDKERDYCYIPRFEQMPAHMRSEV